jgi:polyhydroxybutyrate depolymerase
VSAAEALPVGALERQYRLHIPLAYQASVPTPLVLSFHGRGGSAMQDERFTGLSRLADLHHFIAVYPQGMVGPDGVTGWNTSREKDPTADDLLFVDTLITHLQGALCVDPQRIYAMGFSNGGGFTAVLACAFADRVAAFAPVAGDYYPQPGGCHPARPAAIVEIHGTADSVNPYNGSVRLDYQQVGEWLSDWAARDGCGPDPTITPINLLVTEEAWGDCQAGAAIVHYRINGGGHTWPSQAALTTLASRVNHGGAAGATGDTFDATSAIWAFFARFALPNSNTSIAT